VAGSWQRGNGPPGSIKGGESCMELISQSVSQLVIVLKVSVRHASLFLL